MASYEVKHSADGEVLGIIEADSADEAIARFAGKLYATSDDDEEEDDADETLECPHCQADLFDVGIKVDEPIWIRRTYELDAEVVPGEITCLQVMDKEEELGTVAGHDILILCGKCENAFHGEFRDVVKDFVDNAEEIY